MTWKDDTTGMVYSNNNRTLDSVPSGTVHVSIWNRIEILSGKSGNLYAFKECSTSLKSISFENNPQLKEIQSYAFYQCTSISAIDLSVCTNLITIGSYSFSGCTSLNSIFLPSNLIKLGDYCFSNINATSISLSESITSMPPSCFRGSKYLISVEIPLSSNITSLSSHFIAETPVTKYTITDKVNYISNSAFSYSNIVTFVVTSGNEKYKVRNNAIIISTAYLVYPKKLPGPATVPDGITILEANCFMDSFVTSITLPASLRVIAQWAFVRSKIKSTVIPDTVTSIGCNAFYMCSNLKIIKLPNISTLETELFKGCTSLTEIEIPSSITTIKDGCFDETNLSEVVLPDSVESIGGNAFPSKTKLIFGKNSNYYIDSQYLVLDKQNKSISMWFEANLTTITIPSTVETIQTRAFNNKQKLTKIVINSDSALNKIEKYAFYNCTNLVFANLPQGIASIGEYSFYGCQKLTNIDLPYLINISMHAFENCINLVSIEFETCSVTTLDEKTFYQCQSLTSIKLPHTLTYIDVECFKNCNSLTSVSFPSTLVSIIDSSFENCNINRLILSGCNSMTKIYDFSFSSNTGLTEVSFPTNIESIGVHSFSGTSIRSITLPSSVKSIYNYAFSECSNLQSIFIPSDSLLSEIGIGVFKSCFSISTIECSCPRYSVFSGALFDSQRTNLILFPPASNYIYFSLPDTTKTISSSAFQSCIYLVSVFIPSFSVTRISSNAFEGCISLKSINIPLCVTYVGIDAFLGCTSLECGLNIESKNKTFVKELLKDSQIPSISISSCSNLLSFNCKCKCISINNLTPFIIFNLI